MNEKNLRNEMGHDVTIDMPQVEFGSRDVEFSDEQLVAARVDTVEDPWGAYSNPENIPGMSLDEDEDAYPEGGWAAMALRSSGTRGGNNAGAGRMAPMMPMAGAAGAGTVGAGTAPNSMMLPAATLGGVGGAQGLAAQQVATYQAATNAMGGSGASVATLAGLNSTRATSAMFSPSSSGVIAAGGDFADASPDELAEAMQRAGADSSQQFIVGPDGNLYPNPYYTGDGETTTVTGGPRGSIVAPYIDADLNGDGVVSEQELARWKAGQHHVSLGNGHTDPGPIAAFSPGTQHSVLGSSDGLGGGPGGVLDGSSGIGLGIRNSISGRQLSEPVRHLIASGKKFVEGAANEFIKAGEQVARLGGQAVATAKDFSVHTDQLRNESKVWDAIAKEQANMATRFDSLVGDHSTFGVMTTVQPAYEAMRRASVSSTKHRTGTNEYTSLNMVLSAGEYDETETRNAQISDREIP